MLLLKFLRPEHVVGMQQGMMHFQNTGYFIDLEINHGEIGIGDRFEGSYFRNFNPATQRIFIIDSEGNRMELVPERGFTTERYEVAREFQLICFTKLTSEHFEETIENSIAIKKEVIESLKHEFPGRIPVLVTNEELFFEKVHEKMQENGYNAKHSFVKYFDENEPFPLSESEYENDMTLAFFYKRKLFETQMEYRIVTSHPVPGEFFQLELGVNEGLFLPLQDIDDLGNLSLQVVTNTI